MSSILLETINELNDDSFLGQFGIDRKELNEIEMLSEIGSTMLFVQNNYRDCVNIFGAKVTGELIEDINKEYKNIITEGIMSNGVEKPKPMVDFKSIWDTIKNHGGVIGATALAALVITASYKIYKNYFSKAAKACKGKTASEKEACMNNYRANAYKMQQNALKKSLSMADKTSDPKSFKKKIEIRLQKLKSK